MVAFGGDDYHLEGDMRDVSAVLGIFYFLIWTLFTRACSVCEHSSGGVHCSVYLLYFDPKKQFSSTSSRVSMTSTNWGG